MPRTAKEKNQPLENPDPDTEDSDNKSDDNKTVSAIMRKQVGTMFRDPEGHTEEKRNKAIAKSDDKGSVWSRGGRDFEIKTTSGQAQYVQGVQGNAKVVPNTGGQPDSFTVGEMGDQSFGLQGYNSEQSIRDVLKSPQEIIQSMHANKQVNSSSDGKGTNFRGAGRQIGEVKFGYGQR